MAEITVYEDLWGKIVDHAADGILEIRWVDASAGMTTNDFNQWLIQFATDLARLGRRFALVDAVQFRMARDRMDGAWRDANVIPRYNKAGVQRFAFVMPPQMPLIGTPPAPEGPADFPTGYFGTRADAFAWLGEAVD
jgi:hypothetical protein